MRKKAVVILVIFFCVTNLFAHNIYMFGPTVHFNLGKQYRTSIGFEASWWNFDNFPAGMDVGFEIEKSHVRLYSELQSGLILAGFAVGPVMQINTDTVGVRFGIQGSFWANVFLGVDARVRYLDQSTSFCPGMYFKLPVATDVEYKKKRSFGNYED